jgi:hypothetical protein
VRIESVLEGTSDRLNQLVGFLDENADPGVRLRSISSMEKAAASNQCVVVLDDDRILGCSMTYAFEGGESQVSYLEIGTMRVIRQGLGLQEFMAQTSILGMYLEGVMLVAPPPPQDPSPATGLVFAVVAPNSVSEHVLVEKVGMIEFNVPEELALARAEAGAAFDPAKRTIYAPPGAGEAAEQFFRSRHVPGSHWVRTGRSNDLVEVGIPSVARFLDSLRPE